MARRRVTAQVDIDADGARSGAAETEKSAGRISGAFEGLKGKAGSIRESLGGLGDKFGELARDKLGPLGDAADKAGIDLDKMGNTLPVVGAAVAGATAFVAAGIGKWQELTAQVKTYTTAAGLGAEEASRFNAVFKDFGVEAEDGADALKTMGEIIGTDAAKFDTYGVAIARAKDGSVDMAATLGNVADRFRAMRDPTERAALGSELFGDAWLKIAPVLEQGSDNLDRLLAGVKGSALVTDEGIRKAAEYDKAMAQLSREFEALQIAAAEEAIPAIVDGLHDLTGALQGLNDFEERFGAISKVIEGAQVGLNPLKAGWDRLRSEGVPAWGDYFDAVEGGRPKLENLVGAAVSAARAQEDTAAAAALAAYEQKQANQRTAEAVTELEDLETALDAATAAHERAKGSVVTAFEANVRYDESAKGTADALDAVTTAAGAVATATAEHGAESEAATTAQADYSRALSDAEQKVYAQAKAAVDLAQKQAEVSGATLTTAEGIQVYRDKLVEARDATDDPVLKQALSDRINQYDSFSVKANDTVVAVADANTKLADAKVAAGDPALSTALDTARGKFGDLAAAAWDTSAAANAAARAIQAAASSRLPVTQESGDPASLDGARAAGGPVLAGQSYLVGERGPEVLTMGATGFVTPPDRFGTQRSDGAPIVIRVEVDGRQMAEAAVPHLEQERRSRL